MRILGNILYGLCIALIGATALLLAGTFLPPESGYALKIVRSGSMEPAIPTGALVLVRPAERYEEGEVITFAPARFELPVTHRIVGAEGVGSARSYLTQGDANEEPDQEVVAHASVLGSVRLVLPYAGYVIDFARTPLGFALLVVVPAATIIIDELWSIARETRRLLRKRKEARRRREGERLNRQESPAQRLPRSHSRPLIIDIQPPARHL